MKRIGWWLLPLLLLASWLKAEPIPSSVLYATPAMWDLSLNSSGELLTFQQFDKEEGYVLSAMTTAHRQATPILAMSNDRQRLQEYRWLDDQHIYVKLRENNKETADILTLKVNAGIVEATLQQLKITADLVSGLLPDGTIYIAANQGSSGKLRLYRVKLADLYEYKLDPATLVDEQLTDVVNFTYDRKQRRFFAIQADVSNKTMRIFTRLLDDTRWREVFSEIIDKDSGMTLPAHISADGSLFVLSNAGRDKVGLYKYNNQTKTLGDLVFEHPRFDLNGAEFDEQDRLTSVSFVDDGRIAYRYFNDEHSANAAKLQALYPGKTVIEVDRAADGHVQLLNVSANDDPGMAVLYQPQSAQLFSLGDYYPELRQYQRYPTQVLDVQSDPGVQLEAYLTRPAAAIDNKVLLVMPHGGPVAVRDYNTFNAEVQYFVSRGFSVLRVNFRGSSGFGKKFVESGVGQFGKQIEHDISVAVAKVRSQYTFNKSCAMGSSYGGYSALMLAIQHPELYQCAIGAYGIYDLPLLFNASNYKADQAMQKLAERTVGKNSDALVDVSPVYLSDKVQIPVLLIAGLSDMTAEPEHTKRMAYVLKAAGKPVKTLYYAETGHGPKNSFWEKHEIKIRYDFIRQTLGLPADTSLVTSGSKAAIALGRDYALFAYAYQDNTLIDQDSAAVTRNLEQAIALGDDEANRDLAIDLLQKRDEKSTARAISLLKAAAEQHKVLSAMYLGYLYRTGSYVPRNPELSAAYYDIAYQYGHSATAMVRLAYAYCTGKGKPQQWDRCLELLDLPKYIKQPRASRHYVMNESAWNGMRSVIAEILTDVQLTPAQLADVSDILQRQYATKPVAEDVQIVKGISNSSVQLLPTSDATASIAERQTIFANIHFTSKEPTVPTAFTYDWQQIQSDGATQRHSSGIVYGLSSLPLQISLNLDKSFEPGIYRLTIYDLNGKQLLRHDFTVVQ